MRYLAVALVCACSSVAYGQAVSTGSLSIVPNSAPGGPIPLPIVVPQVGNVTIVNPKKLDILLHPDQTATTSVEILSDKDFPNGIQFYLSLKRSSDSTPCRASVTTLPVASGFQKGVSRLIPIEITGCSGSEADGVLGILGSSGIPREIPVSLKRASSHWLTIALFGCLLLAVVIVIASGRIVRKHGFKLNDKIGGATWDFTSSWASNITAFGAAFSAFIQLTMFPDKPALGSRTEYAFLAAFSLALVALAPAIQRLTNRVHVEHSGENIVASTNSIIAGFLTASAFTVWGTLLQIAVQFLIILELGIAVTISCPTAICADLCVAFAGVCLVIYCCRTIPMTVAANAIRTGIKKGSVESFGVSPFDSATPVSHRISVL
jgi:hypothetical protein